MIRKLEKIEKISCGILQLITAMDKGFARVENDINKLRKFREICYHVHDNFSVALNRYKESKINIRRRDPLVTIVIDKNCRQQINNSLLEIRKIADQGFDSIIDFIEEYPEEGNKSYSLDALQKFKSVLEKEFLNLEQEINALKMEFILEDRKEQLLETIKTTERENHKSQINR